MGTYPFLSDDWFEAVDEILVSHTAVSSASGTTVTDVVMNLTVTETPFDNPRELHVGSLEGSPLWGREHHSDAHLTITVDYVTAKQVFVSGDAQAALSAFMAGRVKVQGDLTRLMALVQGGDGGTSPGGLAETLQTITE